MFSSFSISTKAMALGLVTLATILPGAAALGCYGNWNNDVPWTSIDSALKNPGWPAIAEKICDNASKDYYTGEKRDGCFNAGSSDKVNWQVKNISGHETNLPRGECIDNILKEMFGCAEGSEQNHGNFYYYLDPNNGQC
ncbi:hypothetical protein MN608_04009 [Microdochium nivale]|nr:hypothetical protein MN608_04009 [Microdochium nivale]